MEVPCSDVEVESNLRLLWFRYLLECDAEAIERWRRTGHEVWSSGGHRGVRPLSAPFRWSRDDLAAEESCVEAGEFCGIRAVDDDLPQVKDVARCFDAHGDLRRMCVEVRRGEVSL